MQVSVEAADGLERRIKVELPADEIEQEVDKRLRDVGRSARLPGFRPGKVPMKVLRQRFGDSVRGEVFGERIQSSFPEAVAEAELKPVGMPEIEPEIDRAERRYSYIAKFKVLPAIEPVSLADKTVSRPVAEVTDADVDTMIERLREQRKTWNAVDRPAAAGDRVRLSFQGTIDGEPFEGGSGEEVAVDIGAGRMIPGFEEQLTGAAAGDERAIETTFPDDYHRKELAGKPAHFNVQIKEVQEPVLPEVDADFASALGIADGDIERFRSDVRANMERELAQRIKDKVKSQVMDLLVEAHPVHLPEVLIAEETKALKEQMRQNVGAGADLELPDELFADSARRRVALGLIIAELVRRHNLQTDPERVRQTVSQLAAAYEDPQAVMHYYYSDAERMKSVESLVLEERVVEHVLAAVEVTEQPMSFEELTRGAAAS